MQLQKNSLNSWDFNLAPKNYRKSFIFNLPEMLLLEVKYYSYIDANVKILRSKSLNLNIVKLCKLNLAFLYKSF